VCVFFAGVYLAAAMYAVPTVLIDQQVTVTAKADFSAGPTKQPADAFGVVVWLEPAGNQAALKPPSRPQHRQLLQKNKTFSPHLLVVPVGSTVDFPNQDPFFHNVFSLFDGKRFDLGLYEAGATRPVVFNKPGISYIFCNIHSEMSAVVITLTTPYYGISQRNGSIEIPNVPPGRYELYVWHERVLPETLNNLTHTVVISDASSSLGAIHLAEQRSLSQSHKNKYGKDYDPLPEGTAYPKP
jgi:plastocyanin